MDIHRIIKYLHKRSLNACNFAKSLLGCATRPFQPSFYKPIFFFLPCCLSSLFCFSLSVTPKHTESKPRPHITLPTVGTLYTVHTDEYPTAQANLMICILVLGQHRSLQNTQFHSLNYELFTLMGQL